MLNMKSVLLLLPLLSAVAAIPTGQVILKSDCLKTDLRTGEPLPCDEVADREEQVKVWPHPHLPPLHPVPTLDLSKYTIGQILNWTLHHPEHHDAESTADDTNAAKWPPHHPPPHHKTLQIHKLAWAVNTSEMAKKIYNDESLKLTLLAPDDFSLRPPHRRPHRRGMDVDTQGVDEEEEDVNVFTQSHPLLNPEFIQGLESSTKTNSTRSERFQKILSILLRYTTLPGSYSAEDLLDKSTVATALKTWNETKAEKFRVRVQPRLLPRPTLTFNGYAKTNVHVKAKNGWIHVISAPILPPLSPLSMLFLIPDVFSTLTSHVQKTELDSTLSPWLHSSAMDPPSLLDGTQEENEVDSRIMSLLHEIIADFKSKPTPPKEFTIFAPTNGAFKKLGWKINLILGSPFGRNILKKVLSYHVVPGFTFHSDYVHNATSTDDIQSETETEVNHEEFDVGPMDKLDELSPLFGGPKEQNWPGHHEKINVTHYSLPTFLSNHSLHLGVAQWRFAGKGPLMRKILIKQNSLPHPPRSHADDENEEETIDGPPHHRGPHGGPHGGPHRGGRKFVPVVWADGVAWKGAFHVIPEILIPRVGGNCPHKNVTNVTGEHEDLRQFLAEL